MFLGAHYLISQNFKFKFHVDINFCEFCIISELEILNFPVVSIFIEII